MQDYCMSICDYDLESPKASYSDDSQAVDNEYPPSADDAQYFDIDISLPFSPTSTCVSSSDDVDSEDVFELDLSICSPNPPNRNQCISPPADSLFYQGQLLPLQLIPPPPEYDMNLKDIRASPDSFSSVPAGIKTHFPKLLKTATKLKLFLFRFRKWGKLGMDLQSPSVESGTSVQQKLPNNDSYMSSERSMTLMEVQGAIQGAIAHCNNHIHRW